MNSDLPADGDDIPEGFTPLNDYSGYSRGLAPVYRRQAADGGVMLGLRVAAHHLNLRGIAHGGMLATLADVALGMNVSRARQPPRPIVTVTLSSDYLDAARPGDWLEAHVTIRKQGRRLAFGECLLTVGQRTVLRASGVFTVVGAPGVRAESDG